MPKDKSDNLIDVEIEQMDTDNLEKDKLYQEEKKK